MHAGDEWLLARMAQVFRAAQTHHGNAPTALADAWQGGGAARILPPPITIDGLGGPEHAPREEAR
jgi:hypothetical protein